MITVKEVETKKEQKQFLNFPLKMYKKCPYFAPPLYIDEKKIFTKKNIYLDQCESVFYNAYRDGKMVGRISGILQKVSNEKNKQNRVRFTRFDSIDDQEVANALFNAVESWALSKNMDTIVGPLGYSDLEREGLLIEGFDQLSTFEEQYNYSYYQKLIENAGYEKEIDWLESQLRMPDVRDERITRISSMMLNKYNLHYGTAKNTRQFVKKYADKLFQLLDETYENLYGTVPFSPKMKETMIANFKLIININNVAVILDEDENLVAFGICFPSISKALQKSSGHLTPAALLRVLKAIKHPKVIDLALIGVLPKYRMKGISTSIIDKILDMLSKGDIEYAETNLNLETNAAIQNQWKIFNTTQHKRRRSFTKKIK